MLLYYNKRKKLLFNENGTFWLINVQSVWVSILSYLMIFLKHFVRTILFLIYSSFYSFLITSIARSYKFFFFSFFSKGTALENYSFLYFFALSQLSHYLKTLFFILILVDLVLVKLT